MSVNNFCSDLEIKELILQYKEHECLWNIYSPNYKDKSLKQKAWLEIADFFHKSPNEVKRKIQYLRAAYVHEKKRVDASKKYDKTLHIPSLFYYKEMDFLDSIVIWRKFDDSKDTSNIYSESIGGSQDFEVKEFIIDRDDDYIEEPELTYKLETRYASDYDCLSSTSLSRSEPQHCIMTKKNHTVKAKGNKTTPLTSATKPQTKCLYYSFGKTIALQLQHLPLANALLAMSEIQNIITMKSLEYLRSIQNDESYSETEENCNDGSDENYNNSL